MKVRTVEIEPGQFLEVLGNDQSTETLARLPDWGFAVVGSREPDPISLNQVRLRISELKKTNLIIVSGLARGIDQQAHLQALENGLKTVAVLGCGVDRCYPASARNLYDQILSSGGLIVSPFASGTPPERYRFILRNQWIAKLSRATWIVQAKAGSGALSTAKFALEAQRDLYVTPQFPGDPRFQGNEKLLSTTPAIPYFSSENLCQTWMSLASLLIKSRSPAPIPEDGLTHHAQKILVKLNEWNQTQKKVTFLSILEWSEQNGWTRNDFFNAYRELKQKNQIVEQGTLVYVKR